MTYVCTKRFCSSSNPKFTQRLTKQTCFSSIDLLFSILHLKRGVYSFFMICKLTFFLIVHANSIVLCFEITGHIEYYPLTVVFSFTNFNLVLPKSYCAFLKKLYLSFFHDCTYFVLIEGIKS